jgi:ADP-ribosyl-[dinitrogen reductase] hydrolase
MEMPFSLPESELNGGPSGADLADRLTGALLGTALGDALGLATEGMCARAIARRFRRIERFHLLGATGFVSDDTEQAALVAQSLARHPDDVEQCARDFRRALLGWFCRLPWGIGRATVVACLRIALGLRPSGIRSAGNGAAMRAAIIGVFFRDEPRKREQFGRAIAEVTHRDNRAVEGALYVAEMAAACARSPSAGCQVSGKSLTACYESARPTVKEPSLRAAIDRAGELASQGAETLKAAEELKTTGFILHTVPFATFCFLRYGDDPFRALTEAINAGGDTDSIGAILGAWLGALHGEAGLPVQLLAKIHDGPFGPTHLRSLARCLARIRGGQPATVPGYSAPAALLRNLALWPVVLGHGFRRLLWRVTGPADRRERS